jgi:flagella basal body P-ring formation protein FlgA
VAAGSDQIVAGDLAVAFPEWAAVPAATPLGLAPAPGVERVLRLRDLLRVSGRWGVAVDRDVCVTRPAAVLKPERLLAAMRKEMPQARIELLDFSRMPAPEGDLVFPAAGLRQSPAGGYWNGYVVYGAQHRFTVWARVKVTVPASRVVAAFDLKPGQALGGGNIRVETRDEAPAAGFLATLDEAAGKSARRAIPAGTALRAEWLEPAKVVLRGETVQVEAVHGAARLTMECLAEGSGAVGDVIAVLNPSSQRRFQARVESRGRVVVTKGSL